MVAGLAPDAVAVINADDPYAAHVARHDPARVAHLRRGQAGGLPRHRSALKRDR